MIETLSLITLIDPLLQDAYLYSKNENRIYSSLFTLTTSEFYQYFSYDTLTASFFVKHAS